MNLSAKELYLIQNVFPKVKFNPETSRFELPKSEYAKIDFSDASTVRLFEKMCLQYNVYIDKDAMFRKRSGSQIVDIPGAEPKQDLGATPKSRSTRVSDFSLGTTEPKEYDIPAKATIHYNDDTQVIYQDTTELKERLDRMIRTYVRETFNVNQETGERELVKSIQLNNLVDLKLSEDEMFLAIEYLQDQNIIVRGYSSDLAGTENYVYVLNYKYGKNQLPNKVDWIVIEKLFWELKDLKSKRENEIDPVKIEELDAKIKTKKIEIVDANRRLIDVFVERDYKNTSISKDDIKQMAYVAVHEFIDRFDVSRGYRFSTYLYRYMPYHLNKMIEDQKMLSVPVHAREKIRRILKTAKIIKEIKGEVTDEDIAIELDMRPEDVRGYMRAYNFSDYRSLTDYEDNWLLDEDDNELSDVYDPEEFERVDNGEQYFVSDFNVNEELDYDLLCEKVKMVLSTLTPREQQVLTLRFGLEDGLPRTLEEVGSKVGVTRERIRKIEVKALRKLRHPSRANMLTGFLECEFPRR